MIFISMTEFCVSENNHEEIEIRKKTRAFSIPELITNEMGLLSLGLINSET